MEMPGVLPCEKRTVHCGQARGDQKDQRHVSMTLKGEGK